MTIYTAPAMFYVQGVLINTEELGQCGLESHVYSLNMDTFTDIELVPH